MDKLLHRALLLDFYGVLLTERQYKAYESHYLNDLSLNEIADDSGVSAQSVWDLVRRSEKLLQGYEEKLALIAADVKCNTLIDKALSVLDEADGDSSRTVLRGILEELREV